MRYKIIVFWNKELIHRQKVNSDNPKSAIEKSTSFLIKRPNVNRVFVVVKNTKGRKWVYEILIDHKNKRLKTLNSKEVSK